ncbi:unnamed protein product, partial [Choristocarpus tenellus]
QANKYYTIDSAIALFVAFLINLAVVGTFARQFYAEECASASTQSAYGLGLCQEIGLSSAGDALKQTLGGAAKYVWAIGLLVSAIFIRLCLLLYFLNGTMGAGVSADTHCSVCCNPNPKHTLQGML